MRVSASKCPIPTFKLYFKRNMTAKCLYCNKYRPLCHKKEWKFEKNRLLHKECYKSLKKTHGERYIKHLQRPPCPVCKKHTYTWICRSGANMDKMYAKCRDCDYISVFGYDQPIAEVDLIDCAQCAHTTYIRTPTSGYRYYKCPKCNYTQSSNKKQCLSK